MANEQAKPLSAAEVEAIRQSLSDGHPADESLVELLATQDAYREIVERVGDTPADTAAYGRVMAKLMCMYCGHPITDPAHGGAQVRYHGSPTQRLDYWLHHHCASKLATTLVTDQSRQATVEDYRR